MKKEITLLDGAMGSELRDRGCVVPSHTESIWSAQVLLDSPAVVREVHEDYIAAGSDVIIINNYAVTHDLLGRLKLEHKLQEMTAQAVKLAQEASYNSGRPVRIAGSLPPLNTSYRADLVGEHQDLVRKYTEILEVLQEGCDLVILESMASQAEAIGALEACKAFDLEVWLSFTLHGNRKNTLPSGEALTEIIDPILDYDIQALLVNCCATNQLTEAIQVIAEKTDLPFGGYANPESILAFAETKGVDKDPETSRESSQRKLDIDAYTQEVQQWLNLGATIIGGCCRTKPAHIQRMKELI